MRRAFFKPFSVNLFLKKKSFTEILEKIKSLTEQTAANLTHDAGKISLRPTVLFTSISVMYGSVN